MQLLDLLWNGFTSVQKLMSSDQGPNMKLAQISIFRDHKDWLGRLLYSHDNCEYEAIKT